MASMHARGKLHLDEPFVHEGIMGTVFVGRILRETTIGSRVAIVPEVSGQAWVTQDAKVFLDSSDPFPHGYTVPDIWSA